MLQIDATQPDATLGEKRVIGELVEYLRDIVIKESYKFNPRLFTLPNTFNQLIEEAKMTDAALKTARSTAKAQFTRSANKLTDSLNIQEEAEKVPISTIKRRFEDVSGKWSIAQDAHDTYVASLTDASEDQLQTEEEWIQDISNRFDRLEVLVDKHIELFEKARYCT